jgi:hypothetical protein
MGAVLDLESFDKAEFKPEKYEPKSDPLYVAGFNDGRATAESEIAVEQNHMRASVVEGLTDGIFGYQEAQLHFLSGMTAYVDAVLEMVLPAVLTNGLHAQLRDLLIQALEVDADLPIELRLPVDQVIAFQAAVADLNLKHVTLIPDHSLTDHAAFITSKAGKTSLDLDRVLQAIKDHSEILKAPTAEVS